MLHAKYNFRPGHILLTAVGVYILLTTAYTGFVVHQEKSKWLDELDRDLSGAARTIPFVMESGFFERAVRPGAISEEEDLKNIERLTRLSEALDLAYLYTLTDVDGTVYITSSSASAEERETGTEVRAFTSYPEMAEEVRATIAAGTPHFRTYTDRWGTFRHVYIPMKTPQGIPYVLAADQSTEALSAHLTPLIIQETSVPLFFVLAVIPFFIAYRIYLGKNTQHVQRLNQSLSKSKDRFLIAAQAGGIGVWEHDIIHNRIVWDDRMYALYGVHKEDFAGAFEAWQKCVHPDDRERTVAEVAAAEQGKKEFNTEFRILRPDGEIRHIRAFGKVIHDKNGKPVRMIGTNQDITDRKEAENKINRVVTELKLAQQIAKVGNWELDPAVGIPQWSDEVYRIYEREAALGPIPLDEYPELYSKKYFNLFHSAISEAIEDGTPYNLELFLRLPSGTEKWIQAICKPDKEKGPAGHFLYGTIQDVTERREAEIKLRESEEKLRGIIENSTNMFYSHTPDHVLTFVSPQVKDILGYEVEQALQRWTEMAADNPATEQGMKLTEEAIRTGKPQPVYQLQLIHKDGHPVWVEVREAPVVEDGRTVAIVGSLNDITERKIAEEALIQSEALKNKMVSNIGDVIVIIDQDGINRYKSPSIENLFGWKPEVVVGRPALDLVHPEDTDQAVRVLGRLMATPNATESTEVRYRCKDGTYRWINFTGTNLVHDPDITGILGNYHDITDRKEAEEALKGYNDELRRFNKAAVGREIRMVELKKQVNALCREIGRSEPYSLFSGDNPDPEEPNA